MPTNIKSLDHLAIVGVKANPQPGEVFAGGTLNGDRMVLSFKRSGFSRHACKGIARMRLVTCERSYDNPLYADSSCDFVWLPTVEVMVTL